MMRKIASVLLIVALPLLLQATTGCVLDTEGLNCGPDCLKPPAESNVNSYVCSCSCTPASHHLELRVSTSADDAEEIASGFVPLDGLVLDMGIPETIGIRFPNLAIPPDADILSAHVQFTAAADNLILESFEIVGEAADDALPFSTALNDLTSRAVTSPVNWPAVAGWLAEQSGPAQQTSDLEPILQEIVDRDGWAKGNAIVLLVTGTLGADVRRARSYDGNPNSAPLLVVDYRDPAEPPIELGLPPVCVLPESNPNRPGGTAKSDAQLMIDCQGRVETTVQGLAAACGYPSACDCDIELGSQRFSDTCDNDCIGNAVDMDCADFDPSADPPILEATNAPVDTDGDGTDDVPVCLANSPLASGLYGRRTQCNVTGTADILIDEESPDDVPAASGVLYFLGDPCPPGQSCAVGMEYRLDLGSVTFSSLFDSETFENLAGLGESLAGADAVLSSSGAGTFGPAACMVSARGTREGEQRALATTNNDVINVDVDFGSVAPMCSLSGALVGTADPEVQRCEDGGNICGDDSDCAEDDTCSEVGPSPLVLGLNVAGGIVNQPPTADAGDDQTVECPAAAILDATGSSDLDSNITLFSWRRGSRIGEEVGSQPMSSVQQGLGTLIYVLRVIDAFGQADEDATAVTVEDTMPPELSCSVAMPVLQQTNHNMVNVGLASRARDLCEGELPVTASVFADEDDEMQTGDGNFSPDGKSIAVDSLRLRAERQGNSDGRVYLILVEATDSSGNRGFNCCTVVVPHSRAQHALQSAQAQATAAQAFCLANVGTAPAGYFPIGDGPLIGPKQ